MVACGGDVEVWRAVLKASPHRLAPADEGDGERLKRLPGP